MCGLRVSPRLKYKSQMGGHLAERRLPMYGYCTDCGYMGLVGDEWILFATEEEYHEYLQPDNTTD